MRMQFTSFSIYGRTTSLLLNVHSISNIRHIEIHVAVPLVPVASPFEVKNATTNLKR
jgi:hypothetical protein